MSPKGRNRIQIKWVMAYIKNIMDTLKAMGVMQELLSLKRDGEVILTDQDVIAASWNAGISIHLHTNRKTERWFRELHSETPGVVGLHRKQFLNPDTLQLSQSFNFDFEGNYISLTFSA